MQIHVNHNRRVLNVIYKLLLQIIKFFLTSESKKKSPLQKEPKLYEVNKKNYDQPKIYVEIIEHFLKSNKSDK